MKTAGIRRLRKPEGKSRATKSILDWNVVALQAFCTPSQKNTTAHDLQAADVSAGHSTSVITSSRNFLVNFESVIIGRVAD
jgi:hypothetical protein